MKIDSPHRKRLLDMAEKLAALVPGVAINQTKKYVSLDVGRGRYKNAIGLHPKYVSFYDAGTGLAQKLTDAKLDFRIVRANGVRDLKKFRLQDLGIDQISEREELFRDLAQSSITFAEGLQAKK